MNPGIYEIAMAEYLRIPALSSSLCATILAQSAFHAKHSIDNPDTDNDAAKIGTAIHDSLLEGIDRIAVIDADDWRTKTAKESRDALKAEGKIPLLKHAAAHVKTAVLAAQEYIARSELPELLQGGKVEQSWVWSDDGMLCKARPDWTNDDASIILHVKTTQASAEPTSWIRNQLCGNGYDMAAMFYDRGAMNVYGTSATLSLFLVIEQNAPHGCSLIGMSPALQDLGIRKALRAMAIWRQAQATGIYSAYPAQICYADPLPWDQARFEESELIDPVQAMEGLQA